MKSLYLQARSIGHCCRWPSCAALVCHNTKLKLSHAWSRAEAAQHGERGDSVADDDRRDGITGCE